MITPLPQKFNPGERFGYSNAGFIMLGLVVEAISGVSYQEYVTREILLSLKLKHTGFYRMNNLPKNTALGYTGDASADTLHTNIFSLPIVGGSDGGLYTCAQDLDILWRKVFSGSVLSENMLEKFLKNQVKISENKSYGLGVYRINNGDNIVYYAVGGDFGVDFFTAYFLKKTLLCRLLEIPRLIHTPYLTLCLNIF